MKAKNKKRLKWITITTAGGASIYVLVRSGIIPSIMRFIKNPLGGLTNTAGGLLGGLTGGIGGMIGGIGGGFIDLISGIPNIITKPDLFKLPEMFKPPKMPDIFKPLPINIFKPPKLPVFRPPTFPTFPSIPFKPPRLGGGLIGIMSKSGKMLDFKKEED